METSSNINLKSDNENEIIEKVKENVEQKFKELNTNQVRNFYSKIVEIRLEYSKNKDINKIKLKLTLLKPLLAYAAGRHPKNVKKFASFIFPMINDIVKEQDKSDFTQKLEKFFIAIESFVAYHKYYSKEKN